MTGGLMNGGKRGLTPMDTGAIVLAGIGWLLIRLGSKLWRAVDDNLADYDERGSTTALFAFASLAALLLIALGASWALHALNDITTSVAGG